MSHNDLARPRTVGIGAMAAPLLIVGAWVLFGGVSQPRSSAADVQPPPDPETIIHASIGALTEAQRAALRYHKQIPALDEFDSPFPLIEDSPAAYSDEPSLEGPEIHEAVVNIPTFIVTAVMASGAGNIALINGKACREGDVLEGGCVVLLIDAQAKQVILTNSRGESVTLVLNRPEAMRPRVR